MTEFDAWNYNHGGSWITVALLTNHTTMHPSLLRELMLPFSVVLLFVRFIILRFYRLSTISQIPLKEADKTVMIKHLLASKLIDFPTEI